MASGIWTLDGQALMLYKDLMDGGKMEIEEKITLSRNPFSYLVEITEGESAPEIPTY
ncbi:hypothetical protein I4P18_03110 [Enterobacter roggenkampii]|nr:hypothetical protein [Enterobacter roggenkampii]